MIITVTGKPCSGKGTVSKLFAKNYNFERICTGDMFRKFSDELGLDNILDFQSDSRILDTDKIVDNQTIEIGKTRLDENLIIDSRLAWNFIPKSFKVFIDVSWNEAGKRLLNANRENEQSKTLDEAVSMLQERWKLENERYLKLYNTNNLDNSNYDLVIDSDNKTPEEIVEEIYLSYKNFIKQK